MFAFIGLTFILAAVGLVAGIVAIVRRIRRPRAASWTRKERLAVKELLELASELASQVMELVRAHDRLENRVGILERFASDPDAPRPFPLDGIQGRSPAGPSADEAARSETVPVYSDGGPEEIPAIRPVRERPEAADMSTLDGLGQADPILSPELEELAHLGEPPTAA